MKSTGVIRRIDELGRIVVPKEIRRNLGIRDGESLEIFVDGNQIILTKFSKMKDYQEIIRSICDIVANTYTVNILVTDRDKFIYANLFENLVGTDLDMKLVSFIQNRESILKNQMQSYLFLGEEKKGYYFIQPIISSIDCLGLLILYDEKPIPEELGNLLKLIAGIIVSKVDIA